MKVLLVYPYFLEARIHVEEIAAVPMGLYYIGAMLKAHGHSVEIVNWHRCPDSPDSVKEALISYFVDQLKLLVRRGRRFFYFSDDTFTLDSDRVIDLCRNIVEAGLDIRWQAISRVSAVNDRMLRWMRKAGCVQISYGVESGSERIRRLLGKQIRTEQIEQAFARTTAHGILARAYFIYGAPTESWETIEQSLELIRRIRPLGAIFYLMTLFPGTALYDDFKKRSGMDDDIWLQRIEDILYFEHDPAMDQALVRDFGRHLRKTYHQLLPEFAQHIELEKDSELRRYQAGFLSRLGMTFSHGDYAAINSAVDTSQLALELYRRAVGLYPDHRAYWAMAMVYQRQGRWDQAVETLNAGLDHFPESEELAIGMGVSLMHAARYHQALEYLLPHARSRQAAPYIQRCRRELDGAASRH